MTAAQWQILEHVGLHTHGCPIQCGRPTAPIRRLLRRGLIEFIRCHQDGYRYLRLTHNGLRALEAKEGPCSRTK